MSLDDLFDFIDFPEQLVKLGALAVAIDLALIAVFKVTFKIWFISIWMLGLGAIAIGSILVIMEWIEERRDSE